MRSCRCRCASAHPVRRPKPTCHEAMQRQLVHRVTIYRLFIASQVARSATLQVASEAGCASRGASVTFGSKGDVAPLGGVRCATARTAFISRLPRS